MFRIQVAFGNDWTDWDSFDDREAALEEIASLAADPALARVRLCLDSDGGLDELLLVEGGQVVEPPANARAQLPAEATAPPPAEAAAPPPPAVQAPPAPPAKPAAYDAAGRRLSHPLDGLAQPYGAPPPLDTPTEEEPAADPAPPAQAAPAAGTRMDEAAYAEDEPLDLTSPISTAAPIKQEAPAAAVPPPPAFMTAPQPASSEAEAPPASAEPLELTTPVAPEAETRVAPGPADDDVAQPAPHDAAVPDEQPAGKAVSDTGIAVAEGTDSGPARTGTHEDSQDASVPQAQPETAAAPKDGARDDISVLEELASLLQNDKFVARERGDGGGSGAPKPAASADKAEDDQAAEEGGDNTGGDGESAPASDARAPQGAAAPVQEGHARQGQPGAGRPQDRGGNDNQGAPAPPQSAWRRRGSSLAVAVAAAAAIVSVGLVMKDALPFLNITGALPNLTERWPFSGGGENDLVSAIRARDRAAVGDLLSRGAPAQPAGFGAEQPLLVAARAGDTTVMRLLLDHGADFRAPAPPYSSLFAQVAAEGLIAATGLFLEEGANPDVAAVPGTCRTPLMEAVSRRNRKLATLLVHNGASLAPLNGCNEGVAELPGIDSALLARLQEIELARGRFPSSQAEAAPGAASARQSDGGMAPAAYRNVMFGLSWDDSFDKLRKMAQACDRGSEGTIVCSLPMATWLGDVNEVELVFDEADANRLVSIRAASRAIADGSRAGTGDGAQATFRRIKSMIQDRLPPDHPRFEVEDAPVGMPFWEGLRPEVKGGEFYAYWSDDDGRRPVSIYLALVGIDEREGYYRIAIENPSTRW